VNFCGERRSNETQASKTDLEALLARKSEGKESKLSYNGNLLTENRNGLIVDAEVFQANGTADRDAALIMLEKPPGTQPVTVGGDKGFDTQGFVAECRNLRLTSMRRGRLSRHGYFEERVRHISRAISDETGMPLAERSDNRGKAESDDDRLGQILLSGIGQQSLQCGRHPSGGCVGDKHDAPRPGYLRFTEAPLNFSVWVGPVTTPNRDPFVDASVSLFREPDAGNLPVRFDEREQKPGPSQTGLRRRRESFINGHRETKATARFSTLLAPAPATSIQRGQRGNPPASLVFLNS
jgi:hypothetical protein